MAFADLEFPLSLKTMVSGPEFHTTITETGNGWEYRNADWDDARKRFNAAPGIKTTSDIKILDRFFRARKGMWQGFLVKDWADFQLGAVGAPEVVGTITNGVSQYQISRNYTDAGNTDNRPITKPKTGTVSVYANTTLLTVTTHYTVSSTAGAGGGPATGIITLTAGAQSTYNGQSLGVVCEFFTPSRFDADRLDVEVLIYRLTEGLGEFPEVPIIEIRDFT